MKRILPLVAGLLFLSTLGFGWLRASADYRMDPDGVTQGGGRSASADTIATEQALGGFMGFAASASYHNQVGVVQPIPVLPPRTESTGWYLF